MVSRTLFHASARPCYTSPLPRPSPPPARQRAPRDANSPDGRMIGNYLYPLVMTFTLLWKDFPIFIGKIHALSMVDLSIVMLVITRRYHTCFWTKR